MSLNPARNIQFSSSQSFWSEKIKCIKWILQSRDVSLNDNMTFMSVSDGFKLQLKIKFARFFIYVKNYIMAIELWLFE